MELHPISFNDHEPLLLMCAGKADSPIKGLGLLRFSHGDARSDCMKDWLARWCGCHVALLLKILRPQFTEHRSRRFCQIVANGDGFCGVVIDRFWQQPIARLRFSKTLVRWRL